MTQFKLWKYFEDYGRSGEVEGLFIATEEEVNKYLLNRDIDFGEILGKHSEVNICFDKEHLKCLNVSESATKELFLALDNRIISGHDPFYYARDYLKCTNCGFEGSFGDCWWDSGLLTANMSCPECGSENYEIEEE